MSSALVSSTAVAGATTTGVQNQTSNSIPSLTRQSALVDAITSLLPPLSSTLTTTPSTTSSSLPTTPPVPSSSTSDANRPSLATKIGLGVGVGMLLLLIVIGTCLILRRQRKHPSSPATNEASQVKAVAPRPQHSDSDAKHSFTSADDVAASELMHKNEAKRLSKGRRNSHLAQISEEPGPRPLFQDYEGSDRRRTISRLAHGPPGAHTSTGHISLIQSDDRIASNFQSETYSSLKVPPGDRLSLMQPGDRNSFSDIYASRRAALDTLNGPSSTGGMGSPVSSLDSRSGYTPSLPQRSPRRYSARSRELDVRSIDSRQSVDSIRGQRSPAAVESSPQTRSQSHVVDLDTESSKYAP
ncbi:hypothetical protein FKW77_003981 [Venturia effusa]|uniref:Uncharacterized protein n=1 Tax=Venturia effusa TaxID=50376 RepID=A0A517L331_9PEZI|nr:hypothetical protein FKW77_003981 [Venturia effusa]